MIKPYVPKRFGKEYCEIIPSGQYPMFLAVALGVKPCFDDWVSTSMYDQFVEVCKKYGLVVEPDLVISKSKVDKESIVGGENITTTFFEAKRFSGKEKHGSVHVFVARNKKTTLETKRFGWYPVVINNISVNKPFVDHLIFGKYLGFPDCCIYFFRRFNNWHLYSHPYETLKNTPLLEGRARGSHYCNNFLMDHVYFFIHHIPCSYRCENTVRLAKAVEEKIREVEPDYVRITKEFLKKPLLVFGEMNFIMFDGKLEGNAIEYTDCEYFDNPARAEEKIDFFDDIKRGNSMVVDRSKVNIIDDGSTIKTVKRKPEWFLIGFD